VGEEEVSIFVGGQVSGGLLFDKMNALEHKEAGIAILRIYSV
jgi:hypothetical protein